METEEKKRGLQKSKARTINEISVVPVVGGFVCRVQRRTMVTCCQRFGYPSVDRGRHGAPEKWREALNRMGPGTFLEIHQAKEELTQLVYY